MCFKVIRARFGTPDRHITPPSAAVNKKLHSQQIREARAKLQQPLFSPHIATYFLQVLFVVTVVAALLAVRCSLDMDDEDADSEKALKKTLPVSQRKGSDTASRAAVNQSNLGIGRNFGKVR